MSTPAANNPEVMDTDTCRIKGCEGSYQRRKILHCVDTPDRGRVCIDDVPALVCPVCGDTWFELETVRRLERLLTSKQDPGKQLSVYDFGQSEKMEAA